MKTVTSLQSVATLAVAALMTQLASAQPKWAGTPPPPGEVQSHAHVKQDPAQPAATASPTGLVPAQIRQAYGFDALSASMPWLDGTGQTIAIVDAFGDRYAVTSTSGHKTTTTNVDATGADWTNFCNQFGLPTKGLTVVYPQGAGNLSTNWALETALDIQWAHAIAPGARILLVIAYDASWQNMLAAVDYAVNQGANVVSMSWSGLESTNELSYDAHFNHPGVTFVASSGDAEEMTNGVEYPAASPYVLSVGGTTLSTNADGTWSETAWSGSGGGISLYEAMPGYQNGWQQFSTGNMRSVPDVCYQGGPNPGVSVYVTPYGGWIQVYGTSVGAPQWAALITLANCASTSGPVGGANPLLYAVAASGTNPPYINPAYLYDITSGSNGSDPDDFAVVGYDYVTGLGLPVANNLVPALTNLLNTPDFYLSVSPASATIPATGGMATYTAAITPMGGFADTVNFSVEGLPAGANATFDPNPATSSSILTITLGAGSATGSYPLTITGVATSNSALTRTAAATLAVASTASAVYVVQPSGANGYFLSGGKNNTANLNVQVALDNDFGGVVSNAAVAVTLYLNGAVYGSGSATTASNGIALFTVRNARAGTWTTTVTSVTAAGLTWDGKTPANSYTKN